ncbi:MAG: class I SAM-dependent methyltransferase [Burkholderiales bacterium]|jgi:SAM-dependent methyltransferase
MDAVEERLWWYRALHARLLDALADAGPAGRGRLLDAGCGTGGLLARLRARPASGPVVGLDAFGPAAARARSKSGAPVVVASIDALPFQDAAFDAIVSADVLCHRSVDPARALDEARRCLSPGGVLVLNLPAFRWLASYHDRQVHSARRFDRTEVRALLRDAGFEQVDVQHWNSLLFPVMAARRLMSRGEPGHSDVFLPAGWINGLLAAVVSIERTLGRLGLRWPVGGSILAVARR